MSYIEYYTTEVYFSSTSLPLPVDYDGRGPDVLSAVQTEDMSQVGEQHQRWRLQLQLLPTQNRALRRYVQLSILLGLFGGSFGGYVAVAKDKAVVVM